MKRTSISPLQLFCIIVLFELGSAIVVGVGMSAKRDAWLAIATGLIAGLGLFYIYAWIYSKSDGSSLIQIWIKALGKPIGGIIGFLYCVYFIYIGARVLRDFGDLIITTEFRTSPLFVINFLLILTIMYVLYLGVEVLVRTAQIFFVIMISMTLMIHLLMLLSGLPEFHNIQPVLEFGWMPVLKTAFPITTSFPFGEMIAFLMVFPYLRERSQNKMRRTGIIAMVFSGLILIYTTMVNISVLGAIITAQTPYPFLTAIGKIRFGAFIGNVDVFFLLILIIGGFFKVSIFYFAANTGLCQIFKIKNTNALLYPVGITILLASLYMADDFVSHIKTGLKTVPYLLHIPFQMGLPIILLLVILIFKRNKKDEDKGQAHEEQDNQRRD